MSYIDTFDHELVGFFAGLPIYHPLEAVEGSDSDAGDFDCSGANLVLGGGGGEHPALVLVRPDCAAAHFLADSLASERANWAWLGSEGPPPCLGPLAAFVEAACAVPLPEVWIRAAWSGRRHRDFEDRCRSPALHWPYAPDRHGALDRWLAANFGELVFFSLRELLPESVRALADPQSSSRDPVYLNILVPPPGFRALYGRRVVDGRIVWGAYRWSDCSRRS